MRKRVIACSIFEATRTDMPLVFTGPLLNEMTLELGRKIEHAYSKFPELRDRRVIVGITKKRGLDGYAVGEDFCIRLNVNRRTGLSHFTIGHELTHLLQKPGLGTVPDGEVQCDIWTLARSELFLDEMPGYLEIPCPEESWRDHARHVRELCIQAIEVRRANRRYIVWLRNMLRQYLTSPIQLGLFSPSQNTPEQVVTAAGLRSSSRR